MIERKKGKPRGRPKEVQGDLKSVNIMVENGRFKEFKDLCEEIGVSVSEGVRQLIEEECRKKVMALEENPAKIPYSNDQSNSNQTLISVLANYSDSRKVYHKLQDDNANLEYSETLDAYYRSGIEGNKQYRANLLRK